MRSRFLLNNQFVLCTLHHCVSNLFVLPCRHADRAAWNGNPGGDCVLNVLDYIRGFISLWDMSCNISFLIVPVHFLLCLTRHSSFLYCFPQEMHIKKLSKGILNLAPGIWLSRVCLLRLFVFTNTFVQNLQAYFLLFLGLIGLNVF